MADDFLSWNRRHFLGAMPILTMWSGTAGAALAPADVQRFTPEQFGAKGDGRTNDTAAFAALSKAIERAGGGFVQLRNKAVYIVGEQRPGGGYFRSGADILSVKNIRNFIVDMNQAVMRMAPGLLFGGFEQISGRAAKKIGLDQAMSAHQGILIRAQNVSYVHIFNGELDGNGSRALVGGPWGDTGRQCISYGIHIYGCSNVTLEDLNIHNFPLDAVAIGYTGLRDRAPLRPVSMKRCHLHQCGRNCLSLTGSNAFHAENSIFEDSGNCPNPNVPEGRIRSAPAACVDIEAENAVNRNSRFTGCKFIAGRHSMTAFVADSGDTAGIYLKNCLIDGKFWSRKAGTILDGCEVKGTLSVLSGSHPRQQDNSRILNCKGTDISTYQSSGGKGSYFIDCTGSGKDIVIDGCDFTLNRTRINLRYAIVSNSIFRFAMDSRYLENRQFIALLDAARMNNVTFYDYLPATGPYRLPKDEGYFITTSGMSGTNVRIMGHDRFTLKWNDWQAPGWPNAKRQDGSFSR